MSPETFPILTLTAQKGHLYYYQGNFYHPLDLIGSSIGQVKRAIREFRKANKKMVDNDRKHPDYKSLVQLFDEGEAHARTS